jgi:hypothetical protein
VVKKDMKLIMEEWRPYLNELIKFKRAKRKRSEKGDYFGTKVRPCSAESQREDDDLGDKIFDPYDPNRKTDDWECNTEIEDKLMYALQTYIGANNKAPLEGRVSDFIIDYFKNINDGSLPISRMANDKPLWRGSQRKFDDYGIEFLKNVDFDNPIGDEDSQGFTKYPFKGVYGLRGPVMGFTDDMNVAYEFALGHTDSRPIVFIYETPANIVTKGGGFFIDLDKFYGLRDNPAQKVHAAEDFLDVRDYKRESEILLIGAGQGDQVKTPFVYIGTKHMRKQLSKLASNNQELYTKLRNVIGYSKEELKKAGMQINIEKGRVRNFILKPLELAIKRYTTKTEPLETSIKRANSLLGRTEGRLKFYSYDKELYIKAVGKQAYKEFIEMLADVKKRIEDFRNKLGAPEREPQAPPPPKQPATSLPKGVEFTGDVVANDVDADSFVFQESRNIRVKIIK